jgi:hypothetical protein
MILDGIHQVRTIERGLGLLRARSWLIGCRAIGRTWSTPSRRQVVVVLVPVFQLDLIRIPDGSAAIRDATLLGDIIELVRIACICAVLNRKKLIDPGIVIGCAACTRQHRNRSRRAALNRVLVSRHEALLRHKLIGIAHDVRSLIDRHTDLGSIKKRPELLFRCIPVVKGARCTQKRLAVDIRSCAL